MSHSCQFKNMSFIKCLAILVPTAVIPACPESFFIGSQQDTGVKKDSRQAGMTEGGPSLLNIF